MQTKHNILCIKPLKCLILSSSVHKFNPLISPPKLDFRSPIQQSLWILCNQPSTQNKFHIKRRFPTLNPFFIRIPLCHINISIYITSTLTNLSVNTWMEIITIVKHRSKSWKLELFWSVQWDVFVVWNIAAIADW